MHADGGERLWHDLRRSTRRLSPTIDLLFLFVRSRPELDKGMPKAAAALRRGAALWVFFRKGSSKAGLDMNRDTSAQLAAPGRSSGSAASRLYAP